ncbi:MAG: monovalent cation/H+ antiporter complex subunit F [Candidatus Omnitrophica bacterium]|nr:monovalent cation/H+ antiporter complex subunit F [Candidatus Omnitrophota bacterium]MCM8808743.1 monovalent cation/H+ antiporter complex subunit F [Candidatus Omnitrophota bacterium]MCM8810219.1 monovalent cation/H+ antiporter complex subunit F [Candidatus Omnitrophota bacterium]MCM8833474.1 monovalent cation/H+ antiporter complex subunit F [Candidatus Omnitrophota bacterium]
MITFLLVLLLFSCFLCLYRISRGPSPADRVVGIDILGIIVVNFCAIVTYLAKVDFYMNIALSWALLSFIGTLAVSKFLEGRGFDE